MPARIAPDRRRTRAYSFRVSTRSRIRAQGPLRPFELRLRLPNGSSAVVVMDARNVGEALDMARNALGDVQVIESR
ncbi:hypothetical protein ABIA36_000855 [Leifsonia sp. EB34]